MHAITNNNNNIPHAQSTAAGDGTPSFSNALSIWKNRTTPRDQDPAPLTSRKVTLPTQTAEVQAPPGIGGNLRESLEPNSRRSLVILKSISRQMK